MKCDTLESKRLGIQVDCDAAKGQPERNRLGQFATPTALASDITRHTVNLLPNGTSIHFLDPAVGTGAFFSALLGAAEPSRIERAVGFEIDPHYARPACELWSGSSLQVRLEDFTKAKPPQDDNLKFNLIICNPPYV